LKTLQESKQKAEKLEGKVKDANASADDKIANLEAQMKDAADLVELFQARAAYFEDELESADQSKNKEQKKKTEKLETQLQDVKDKLAKAEGEAKEFAALREELNEARKAMAIQDMQLLPSSLGRLRARDQQLADMKETLKASDAKIKALEKYKKKAEQLEEELDGREKVAA